MAQHEEKYNRRRLRSAYLSTVVSITLVLFLLGVLGVLVIHAGSIARYVKENIILTLVIDDEADPGTTLAYSKSLEATPFIKKSIFISKEQAAEELQEELGEEFIGFLGYNPIPSTLDLYPESEYTHPDSLEIMVTAIQKDPLVTEVKYQKSLAGKIQENIEKITLVILSFSVLLLLVSIVLIHNTIRLSVYSKRFLIRTMYLIGATRSFIRRPFMGSSILQGVIASFLSLALVSVSLMEVYRRFPELYEAGNKYILIYLAAGIFVTGLLITALSTFLAVNKYLNAKKEKLYH